MTTMVTHQPTASAMTDTERRDLIEGVIAYGVQCAVCGRDATSSQIDVYLDRVETDPNPDAWVCPDGLHICLSCEGRGRDAGLAGRVCRDCDGHGEYDEHERGRR